MTIRGEHTLARPIIMGPDGALWFTETGTSRLGRVTLGGEITHYPLPTPNGLPRALVVGSDGNIWFTAPESRKVGRLILDAEWSGSAARWPRRTPSLFTKKARARP